VNAKCKERTESLWSYLLSSEQSDLYMNYLFHYCDRKETVMQISTDPRRLILWEAYHLRYSKEFFENSLTPAVAAMHHSKKNR